MAVTEISRATGVSVVIPVYRAERTLPELYRQLAETMPALTAAFEIVFVEDGGDDGSWALIGEIAGRDPRVRGIRMSRNFGQHAALLAGIRAARYSLVLTIDDDLQHPVSEIRPMLAALGPDHDVVYGVPEVTQHNLPRAAASYLIRVALARAMGVRTAHHVSAFRLFRTRLRDGFAAFRSPNVSIDVLLSWVTTRVTTLPVRHAPRAAGRSGYSLIRLLQHAIDLTIGFSVLPLRLASIVGLVSVTFGLAILLFVLVDDLIHGGAVPGFAVLAAMIAMFSGVQLLALGIVGEYVARMYSRSMNRPTYLISETCNAAEADEPADV